MGSQRVGHDLATEQQQPFSTKPLKAISGFAEELTYISCVRFTVSRVVLNRICWTQVNKSGRSQGHCYWSCDSREAALLVLKVLSLAFPKMPCTFLFLLFFNCFFFFFWLHHVAWGILLPWPGIKPTSPAVETGVLATGPQGSPCFSYFFFNSVQFSDSVVSDSVTPWTSAHQASPSITNSQSPPKPMSIESMMPSIHLILCCPLLLLLSMFPSIRVLSNEAVLHIRWPKYWSFSFSISPSNKHPGLISFRMAWLDLLAVQGTLKSLLQHHSSKASIL